MRKNAVHLLLGVWSNIKIMKLDYKEHTKFKRQQRRKNAKRDKERNRRKQIKNFEHEEAWDPKRYRDYEEDDF